MYSDKIFSYTTAAGYVKIKVLYSIMTLRMLCRSEE